MVCSVLQAPSAYTFSLRSFGVQVESADDTVAGSPGDCLTGSVNASPCHRWAAVRAPADRRMVLADVNLLLLRSYTLPPRRWWPSPSGWAALVGSPQNATPYLLATSTLSPTTVCRDETIEMPALSLTSPGLRVPSQTLPCTVTYPA